VSRFGKNIGKKRRWSLLLFTLLWPLGFCLAASALETGEQFEKVIHNWRGPSPEPLIVPASYLTMDPEVVPVKLPAERMEDFNTILYDLTEGGRDSRCVPSRLAGHYRDIMKSIRIKSTVLGVAQAQDVFFIGTVEGTMIGWDFEYQGPATVVFLRIEEVLKDVTGSLSLGSVVTIDQPFGTLEISGVTFCVGEPDSMIETDPGKRIAVAGTVTPRNDNHVDAADGHMFEVEDGRVMSNRHKYFENEFEPLADLRDALSKE
jgi:hypothetical protein